MSVTLPPDVMRIAEDAVARGAYASVAEFLSALVRDAADREKPADGPPSPEETESHSAADGPRPGESAYDVALRRGLVGVFDGPADLSTNPKHMQGFGE